MSESVDLTRPPDAAPLRCRSAASHAGAARKVLVLGLFPPPLDGQRIVTQRMLGEIADATTTMSLDLDRFPRLRLLSKPLSALAAACSMAALRCRGFSAVYLAPHSRFGLLYSCFLALTCRALGYALYVHYHSYRNVARYSPLMAAFLACCGRNAVHIVLAPPMEGGLRQFYRGIGRVEVVSNAVFVPPAELPPAPERRRIRIGHLSNLSREKGIENVLECLRRLRRRNVEVELRLAGPAVDAATKRLIIDAAVEFGECLRWLGPLPQAEVRRFYASIDVFLFPTQYEHEAEPLVVVDAVSAGVPVIATNRGCLGYLLETAGGYAFPGGDFIDEAVERIALWARDRDALAAASARTVSQFEGLHRASQSGLSAVLSGLVQQEA